MTNTIASFSGPNNDWVWRNGRRVFVTGADLIRQRWGIRARSIKGEWIIDKNAGIPYWEEIFIKRYSNQRIREIFREMSLATQGVIRVISISPGKVNPATRKLEDLVVNCLIEGEEGEEAATFRFLSDVYDIGTPGNIISVTPPDTGVTPTYFSYVARDGGALWADYAIFYAGPGITLADGAHGISISASGVRSIGVLGQTPLTGEPTMSAGDGIELTQAAGNIEIANTGILSVSSNSNGEEITGGFRIVEGNGIVVDALDSGDGFKVARITGGPWLLANSISTVTGTLNSGSVTSTQNYRDSDTYDVQEVAASPGLDIQIIFAGVEAFKKIINYLKYDGTGTLTISLWNFSTAGWDTVHSFTLSEAWEVIEIPVPDTDDYVDGSGEVRVRYYRATTGSAANNLEIDLCVLERDTLGGAAGVTDHGALTGLPDVNDHAYAFLHNGARAMTGTFNLASQLITDANRSSSSWASAGIPWTSNPAEWTAIRDLIGYEGSIARAIIQAASSGAGGVTSLNSLTGDLAIAAGDNIAIGVSDPNITVSVSGLSNRQVVMGDTDGSILQTNALEFTTDNQLVISGGFPSCGLLGNGFVSPGVVAIGGTGTLYLGAAAALTDAHKSGSTWVSNGIPISNNPAEWSDIRAIIGSEGSLFEAILTANVGNTLNGAYDQGGPGAGALIEATDGAVVIQNSGENSLLNVQQLSTATSGIDPAVNIVNHSTAPGAFSINFSGLAGDYAGVSDYDSEEYLSGHRLYCNNQILSMVCEEDTAEHESHSLVSVRRFATNPDNYLTKAMLLSSHYNEDAVPPIYHEARVETRIRCTTANDWHTDIFMNASGDGAIDVNNTDVTFARTVSYGAAPADATYAAGTLVVDWTEGAVQKVSITGNVTAVSFTAPRGVTPNLFIDIASPSGDYTISGFPANVQWQGSIDPDSSAMIIYAGTSATISLVYLGTSMGYRATILPQVPTP